MQIWAESGKSALPICNYSQILYQFLTFTQNLKRSRSRIKKTIRTDLFAGAGGLFVSLSYKTQLHIHLHEVRYLASSPVFLPSAWRVLPVILSRNIR